MIGEGLKKIILDHDKVQDDDSNDKAENNEDVNVNNIWKVVWENWYATKSTYNNDCIALMIFILHIFYINMLLVQLCQAGLDKNVEFPRNLNSRKPNFSKLVFQCTKMHNFPSISYASFQILKFHAVSFLKPHIPLFGAMTVSGHINYQIFNSISLRLL